MTIINTNVKSLIAQDSLRVNNNNLATAMERLSTGKKINSASDDAAGLSISARMTSQIRGLNMAVKNANDGISLAQTAEGAMNEVTNMLQRMRELAVQAGNGTNSAADLASLNDEVGQLKAEIDRIANTTQFNNMNILDGSFAGKLQIGANADQTMDIAVQSVNTAKMGESVDGLAKGATKASLAVSGLSTNAADYAGLSFNASVNGVNTTVTLPVAAAAQPSATSSVAAVDKSVTIAPKQVGAFLERTIDISSTSHLKIAVNDGDVGTFELDIEQAAIDLGYDATKMTGDKFVAAMQKAIDDSTYFSGDNAVTVSLNSNGNVQFTVAGGDQKIAISDGTTTTGLLTKLDGTAAGTTQVNTGGLPLVLSTGTTDATETFGMEQFNIAANKETVTIKVGTGTAASVDLALGNYDNMSDLAAEIQSKIDTSGLFQGNNHVTVSAVRNEQDEWGLTFSSDGGQTLNLSGDFFTAVGAVASTVNNTKAVFPTGVSEMVIKPIDQFGDFTEMTINLNDVGTSGGVGNSFILNVNGGGDITLDLSQAITDLGYTSDIAAISKDQFVAVMQKTIDDSGFFQGDNAVTVGVNGDGLVTLDIAGGVGSAVFKESSAADGLAFYLTGGNGGVVGEGREVVNSGGRLILGGSYNTNLLANDPTPAGQITLTTGGAALTIGDVVDFTLKDTQGNSFDISATLAAATSADLAAKLNAALAASTNETASQYTVSSTGAGAAGSTITIKRDDGVDFQLILKTATTFANAVTLKADTVGAADIAENSVPISSAQRVQTFGFGATRLGAGDGATTDVRGFTLASIVTADDYAFDGYSKAVTAADVAGGINSYLQSYVSGYNNRAESKYVATLDQSGNGITFTAKLPGVVTGAANATITGASGTNKTAVAGAASTYDLENTLTIKLGDSAAVSVNVASSDFEYRSLDALAAKVQSAIDANVNLQGDNRVIVGVRYDAQTETSGLTFTQATGQTMQISGNFISGELKADTTKTIVSNVSGGLDLSANNTLDVTMQDASTGNSVTKTVTLASSSANVSLSDYASLVQSAVNSAFANEGVSVSTSYSNGEMSVSLGQVGNKTLTIGGASMTAAIGQSVTVSNVPTSGMTNMDDVAQAISDDLAAVGAKATFDAATGQLTFDVVGGADGTSSTIVLSGAGLASVQIAGNLSASGVAGDATAVKLSEVSVTSAANATEAIKSIDNAIQYVSNQRSYLGAIQNRLDYTVNNLTNIVTNTSASRSRIEDADYGTETAALAKNQIMSQAATAMLAQANQSAQNVLSLLK